MTSKNISYESFNRDIQSIVIFSSKINDYTWDIVNGDLSTKYLKHFANQKSLRWEYHIIYDLTYSVPVLYFKCWDSNKRIQSLQNVLNQLDFSGALYEEALNWNFVTQKDHPYLNIPYMYIHPCHTSKLSAMLKDHFQDMLPDLKDSNQNLNMVLMWLTTYGQLVNLTIPKIYQSILYTQSKENSTGDSQIL